MYGKLDATGIGTAVDHDVDAVVFHRRIEVFLDDGAEAVDLVDEQDVIGSEVGEQAGQVAGLFDYGSGSFFDIDAQFIGDDAREGGLAETGRAMKEDMV